MWGVNIRLSDTHSRGGFCVHPKLIQEVMRRDGVMDMPLQCVALVSPLSTPLEGVVVAPPSTKTTPGKSIPARVQMHEMVTLLRCLPRAWLWRGYVKRHMSLVHPSRILEGGPGEKLPGQARNTRFGLI